MMQRYRRALWKEIELSRTEPLWIVEGELAGLPYTVVELEHRAAHLVATEHQTDSRLSSS